MCQPSNLRVHVGTQACTVGAVLLCDDGFITSPHTSTATCLPVTKVMSSSLQYDGKDLRETPVCFSGGGRAFLGWGGEGTGEVTTRRALTDFKQEKSFVTGSPKDTSSKVL